MTASLTLKSKVIKGFGRGSKQLGIPTANLDVECGLPTGIYYGTARLMNVEYPMVMSVGWNPFFHNIQKSVEVHILHTFTADFYGEDLEVNVMGFIREEKNFSSIEELIAAIKDDIRIAKEKLHVPE